MLQPRVPGLDRTGGGSGGGGTGATGPTGPTGETGATGPASGGSSSWIVSTDGTTVSTVSGDKIVVTGAASVNPPSSPVDGDYFQVLPLAPFGTTINTIGNLANGEHRTYIYQNGSWISLQEPRWGEIRGTLSSQSDLLLYAPQVWTYASGGSGAASSQHFSSDSTPSGSSHLYINLQGKRGGYQSDLATGGCYVYLTSPDGWMIFQVFDASGADIHGGFVVGTLSAFTNDSDYAIQILPGSSGSLAQVLASGSVTPIADGTYTVGIGGLQNGLITTKSGIITAITESSP